MPRQLGLKFAAVSSGTTDFMANPSAHGYADATNTGSRIADGSLVEIPTDVDVGTGWEWNYTYGYVRITSADTVFEGYRVLGGVDIEANGIIIRDCHISCRPYPDCDGWLIGVRHALNYTVEHCTIRGYNAGEDRIRYAIKSIYGDEDGGTIQYNNIYWCGIGIAHDSGTLYMNYIHDMGYSTVDGGDHTNCIMSNGGTLTMLIQKNTVQNEYNQTSAISLYVDSGNISNRTIDDNLIAGGGYSIYGGSSGDAAAGGALPSNIDITNNRFSKLFYSTGGFNGHVAYYDPARPGNSWSGCVWDDDNSTIASP